MDITTKTICIYHNNCADGFTAAWVVRKAFEEKLKEYAAYGTVAQCEKHRENLTFHGAVYGEYDKVPDVTGANVYVVDFSFKKEEMIDLCSKAKEVIVFDHHASAQKELEGLEEFCPNIRIVFDMEQSGAGITWRQLFPNRAQCLPDLVKYVEDRDLWRFQYDETKPFVASLFSHQYNFHVWDGFEDAREVDKMIGQGYALLRSQLKNIGELIAANGDRTAWIGGFEVPIINVPYMWGSDACGVLCQGEPFAAYYYDLGDTRFFGLRSDQDDPDSVDVSEIAQQYGGGGHKHAAGFRQKLEFNV